LKLIRHPFTSICVLTMFQMCSTSLGPF